MKNTEPAAGLERLLRALERELLEATDEEILAAARELGMNPMMKGSSALFGVTALSYRQLFRSIIRDEDATRACRRRKDAPP